MDSEPLFSVVVPTHDRPDYLREAIASVLAQTVADLECIVVDDAGSVPVVLPGDARVRTVRHSTNRGPGAARNTGAGAARGRYLAFLDDDDLYTPDRLAASLAVLERAPVALCWACWIGDERPRGRRLEGNVYDEILDEITPHINTVTLRRSDYLAMDESYPASAELEWWLRLTEQHAVSTHPAVGSRLRRHDSPRHGNPRSARVAASRRLLVDQAEYFATHRPAHAFRWARIGVLELQGGHRWAAAEASARSLALQPRVRTVRQLLEIALPIRVRR